MKPVLFFLTVALVLSGCGMSIDVVKRYPGNGFYVSFGSSKRICAETHPNSRVTDKRVKENIRPVRLPETSATVRNESIVDLKTVAVKTPRQIHTALRKTEVGDQTADKPGRKPSAKTNSAHDEPDDLPYIVPYYTLVLAVGGLVAVATGFYTLGVTGVGLLVLLVASAALALGSATVLLFPPLRFDPLKTRTKSGGYWGQLLNVLIVSAGWLSIFRVLYTIGFYAAAFLDILDWFE